MSRPWISVTTDPVNHCGFVSGWKAREYVVNCGGRPLWSRLRRAWSTSEQTALDVLAMAEYDGLAVQYERLERDARPDSPAVTPAGSGSFVHVHRLSGHPGSGVVVVRPDGHVGLRSGDAATAAVQDWLRLVGVAPGAPARHGH